MSMLEDMNRAIGYIEENLDGYIDYAEIARAARTSHCHFQRMFVFVIGVPLSEYIRRRRLTLAAFELRDKTVKILDVALKYGYSSADAFTRAFKTLHGVIPSKAREKGTPLMAYPRITFTLSIKGDVAMNYRIVEKKGFNVVGIREYTSMTEGENFKNIPRMWRNLPEKNYVELLGLSDGEPTGILGVCADMYDGGFDYWIAAATSKPCPPGYEALAIPDCT